MKGRVGTGGKNKDSDVTYRYKGYEVVESYDRQRPGRTCHAKDANDLNMLLTLTQDHNYEALSEERTHFHCVL